MDEKKILMNDSIYLHSSSKPLVLINSIKQDFSTSMVIEWIHQLGGSCLRVNGDEKIELVNFSLSQSDGFSGKFIFQNKTYLLSDIFSFWFRRGNIRFDIDIESLKELEPDIQGQISNHLNRELDSLRNSLHYFFENKLSLGRLSNAILDKLIVLDVARQVGLSIPLTSVISNRKDFFVMKGKMESGVITKSISDSISLNGENPDGSTFELSMYTEEIDDGELQNKKKFFPTLVQEKCLKKFELRVFYLDGECYSMAIFSQSNEKTKLDFRKYDFEKGNRNVPYKLPSEVSNKIRLLMTKLQLNTGSIDLIYSTNNDYVFLEVNPVGQFGMVSRPCNYFLEKKIAEYLIKTKN